jgi:hypothetical protein
MSVNWLAGWPDNCWHVRDFSLDTTSKLALGPIQLPSQWMDTWVKAAVTWSWTCSSIYCWTFRHKDNCNQPLHYLLTLASDLSTEFLIRGPSLFWIASSQISQILLDKSLMSRLDVNSHGFFTCDPHFIARSGSSLKLILETEWVAVSL